MKPNTTLLLAIFSASLITVTAAPTQVVRSSRVVEVDQHQIVDVGPRAEAYRRHRRYIIAELDLKPGDTVVDIGAGDGWWAQRMARPVGSEGTIHAGEISDEKVARLKKRLVKMPQVKPYRCPLDGAGLQANSCDMAFLAQTYHHLPKDRVGYLRGLKRVVKPDGRLCIIERYLEIGPRETTHGTLPGGLLAVAHQAGWVLVRFELLPKTDYYLSIFVQRELFPKTRKRRRPESQDVKRSPRPSSEKKDRR
jgi:SAM-dependent methyltransferase